MPKAAWLMPYLLAAIVAASFGSGFGLAYKLQSGKIASMEAGIRAQNHDALMVLGIERKRVATAEKEAQNKALELDKAHESDIATINAYHDRLAVVQLRDPGRKGGGCPLPKAVRPGKPKEPATDGQGLSGELAGFLRGEAMRADAVMSYAKVCRDFVAGLK